MTTNPRVGVAIVLWRTDIRLLERCLEAINAQTLPVYRVEMLVNEDVSGELAAAFRAVIPPAMAASVRSTADNHGFAGGNNILLEQLFADGLDVALVMNPDVFLEPNAIEILTKFVMTRDRPVLAGPLLGLADPESLVSEGRIDTAGIRWTLTGRHLDNLHNAALEVAPTTPQRVAGISGACMCVPVNAYRGVVLVMGEFFDADFVAYREDAELGLVAARLGITAWVVPTARGLHVRTLRGTRRDVSAQINRLGVRNRFLILFKHRKYRPGGVAALARDVVVVGGVLLRERSSMEGLVAAWRLRPKMHAKRRQLEAGVRRAK